MAIEIATRRVTAGQLDARLLRVFAVKSEKRVILLPNGTPRLSDLEYRSNLSSFARSWGRGFNDYLHIFSVVDIPVVIICRYKTAE